MAGSLTEASETRYTLDFLLLIRTRKSGPPKRHSYTKRNEGHDPDIEAWRKRSRKTVAHSNLSGGLATRCSSSSRSGS